MKKQILTLTMCLALTATSALAEGTKTVAQKAVPQAKSAVAATKAVATPTTTAMPQVDVSKAAAKEEAKKRYEEKKAQERQLMYEALGLSPEQKAKAEALDTKTRYGAGPLIRKLQVEARKLGTMKTKKASTLSIWKQQMALNAAKKDVEKYFRDSKKSFTAILTPAQNKQFELIDNQRKAEMQKFRKEHKNRAKVGQNKSHGYGPGAGNARPRHDRYGDALLEEHGPRPEGPPTTKK